MVTYLLFLKSYDSYYFQISVQLFLSLGSVYQILPHHLDIHIKMTLPIFFNTNFLVSLKLPCQDFPGDAVVKNPSANAGDTGLIPGPGRSHMSRSD